MGHVIQLGGGQKTVAVTKFKLTLLATQQANKSTDKVLRQNITTDQEDARLILQRTILWEFMDARFFYKIDMWGGEEISLANISLEWQVSGRGCVNFLLSVAIHRWTGVLNKALWFNIQAEWQSSPSRPLWINSFLLVNKNKEKQRLM